MNTRTKQQKRFDKMLIIITVFLGVLIVGSLSLEYTGFPVYPRAGFARSVSISQGGGLADLYYKYTEIFDFVIFLFLFVGLSQMILKEHFNNVHKSLFVGLGIFLALALVLWENRTGNKLLELSGPVVVLMLAIGAVLVIYYMIKGFKGGHISTIAWSYVLFFFLFFVIFDLYQAPFLQSALSYLPFDLFSVAGIIFIFMLGVIIFNFVKGRLE